MRPLAPLTAVGVLVVVLGIVAYLLGWQLGWIELMVVAAGCLLALLIALPFVIGQMSLDVTRTLDPARVMVGERAVAVLDVHNPGGAQLRPRIIEEALDERHVRIEMPPLASNERHQTIYPLPTTRRGRITVGPAVIARQDPLQLLRREVRHADAQSFWVHPRYVALPALPVGFAKDLEGPTSETSPAGDVAFHALREYELGDDFRHIHWMSTARAGKPMVRHYVDNRRPQLLLVIDDDADWLPGIQFETVMEVAASMAVSSMLHQEPVAVWNNAGPILGRTSPGDRNDILDRLAEAQPTPAGDLTRTVLTGLRTETGTSAVVILTGGRTSEDLLLVVNQARRHARVIVVRVWPTGAMQPGFVPGAKVVDIDSLDTFRRAWQSVAA